MITFDTIKLLMPEFSMVVLATWVIVASAFQPSRWWAVFCGLVMSIVCIALWRQDAVLWNSVLAEDVSGQIQSGPLFVDAFGHLGRWLALILAFLFLPLAVFATRRAITGEYLGAVVLAFVGLMIVSTAADAVLLLLGLELISIPTYFLLFAGRNDRRSAESAAKYFFLSILSSALFVYGLSFVYGLAGTTHLAEIYQRLAFNPDPQGLKFLPLAVVLLFVGLGFKIAAVPFHFYAPDVYQATSSANAGLLAVLPKAAGMIAMARLAHAISPVGTEMMVKLLILMSVASMTLGNASALWQTDLRRLLAYSSIAHAGYMLIGIAAGLAPGSAAGFDGFGASFFYLTVYCLASLGAFATLAYLSNESEECSSLRQLAGLPSRHPVAAGCLAIFMFSLSGIPPLPGFWGKLTLFMSAIPDTQGELSVWFSALLLAAALNAAIAAGYYLRVISTMYFGSSEASSPEITYGVSLTPGLTVLACGLLVLVSGFFAGPLIRLSSRAGESIRSTQLESRIAESSPPARDIARVE